MSNQFSLLKTRRFLPFFLTQYLGAFNDNVFKQGLIILLTYKAVSISTLPVELRAPLCQAIFILPFFLFSATAGQLADRYDKALLIRLVKSFAREGLESARYAEAGATTMRARIAVTWKQSLFGLMVATTTRSMSDALTPDFSMASRAASVARSSAETFSDARVRVMMPVRWRIHSSLESIGPTRSSLGTAISPRAAPYA